MQCVGENGRVTKGGPALVTGCVVFLSYFAYTGFQDNRQPPSVERVCSSNLVSLCIRRGRVIGFLIFSRVQPKIEQDKKCHACQHHHRQYL